MHCSTRVRKLAISATLLLISSSSGADVKLVTQINVTGGGRPTTTQQMAICFKGDLIRTETGRIISFFNTKSQTITTLDKEDRTYRVLPIKSMISGAPGVLSKLQFKSSAEMTPQDETMKIAGYTSRKYVGRATFAISVAGVSNQPTPETTMEIEQWATEELTLPATSLELANPFMRFGGALQRMKGMEPLAKAMAEVKGMPLSSRITVKVKKGSGQEAPPIVTTSLVESVSTAALPASLFRIPDGFTKVTPAPVPVAPPALRSGSRGGQALHKHP